MKFRVEKECEKTGVCSRIDYVSASESVNADRHKMSTPRTLTYSKLMKEISPQVVSGHAKVTVVGCGQVGMACAFSVLTLGVCSDLALVDMRRDAALGEKMDLMHGLAFLGRRVWVEADSDYAVSKVRSCGVCCMQRVSCICSSATSHAALHQVILVLFFITRVLQYSLSLASPARADMGHVHMLRWITSCDAENVTPNASRENKLTLGMAALSFLPAY